MRDNQLSLHPQPVYQFNRMFNAFAADSGCELWAYPVQGGIMAPPITYELDGTHNWQAGVMATSPATAPVAPPNTIRLRRLRV